MRVGPYLIREVSFWRNLLAQVAEDLDRGADRETDGPRKKWLRARACRIRKRLDEGVPGDWKMPLSAEAEIEGSRRSSRDEAAVPRAPDRRRAGPPLGGSALAGSARHGTARWTRSDPER